MKVTILNIVYFKVLIIIMNVTSSSILQKIHYHDSSSNFLHLNSVFSDVFQVLEPLNSLCLVSNQSEFLDTFLEISQLNHKSVILTNINQIHFNKSCDCVIYFDLEVSKMCVYNGVYFQTMLPLYFLFYRTFDNMSYLQDCLSNSWSPEVIVSLNDSFLMELSPIFPRPRSFSVSSVSKVLSNRNTNKLDLGRIVLKTATMNYTPFTIIKDKIDEADGFEVVLLKELSEQLNFTMEHLIFKGWGKVENDSWMGGIGQAMQDGQVDLAVANLVELPLLYKVMDFGPTLNTVKLGFLVRRPIRMTGAKWGLLFRIINLNVWFIILASFIIVVFAYVLLGKKAHCSTMHTFYSNWMGSVMIIIGIYTLSSSSNLAKENNKSRFILTGWSVFNLLLTTYLSSGIFTRLTVPLYTARVDSVEQLVKDGYSWTVQGYQHFNSSGLIDSLFNTKDHWDCIFEKSYRMIKSEEVEMRVASDKKVTIMTQTYGDDLVTVHNAGNISQRALQEFRLSRMHSNIYHVSFGVKKQSPLLETLTRMTLRFQELGLPQYWRHQVLIRWPAFDTRHLLVELDTPFFSDPQILTLDRLKHMFFTVSYIYLLAFLLFILELIFDFLSRQLSK